MSLLHLQPISNMGQTGFWMWPATGCILADLDDPEMNN